MGARGPARRGARGTAGPRRARGPGPAGRGRARPRGARGAERRAPAAARPPITQLPRSDYSNMICVFSECSVYSKIALSPCDYVCRTRYCVGTVQYGLGSQTRPTAHEVRIPVTFCSSPRRHHRSQSLTSHASLRAPFARAPCPAASASSSAGNTAPRGSGRTR